MRLLPALILLLLATAATGVSSAWMGDQAKGPGSEVATGTISLRGVADGESLLPTRRMRPGLTRQATTTVENTGTVPARLFLRLRGVDPADQPLLDRLRIRVEECTTPSCDQLKAPSVLTSWTSEVPTPLGLTPPGTSRSFRTSISWPAEDDQPAPATPAELGLRWSLRTGAEDLG